MEKVINLGIVAHVDAGKTTLTEQLLYTCGSIRAPGRIEDGNTQTDWLAVERERGISVRASSAELVYGGKRINLIDTPGHTDFASEVERAVSVLDAAVLVVSAADGIQGQTRLLWRALDTLRIPVLFFINKADQPGSDTAAVLGELHQEFGAALVQVNDLEREGERDCRSVSRALTGEAFVLAAAENDDVLAEKYLSGGKVTREEVLTALTEQVLRRALFPVVLGAAARGCGVDCLLDTLTAILPGTALAESGEPSGMIYRLEHDRTMGKVSHVRLFDGVLRNRDTVILHHGTEEAGQKVTQIKKFQGRKGTDTGELRGGDIAALYGLSNARAGDWIGTPPKGWREISLGTPLFSVQVMPQEEGDLPALVQAVEELADEDPAMDCLWVREERELQIKIMGSIQLEILSGLLGERYGLTPLFSKPSVIYKETVSGPGIGYERYTMPKPCWAVVELTMAPLPKGSGVVYRSAIKDNVILKRYQNHIETSVKESLCQGLYGWEVTDIQVELTGGEDHHVHTHPLDFFVATPVAVMRGLEACGETLLEPLYQVRLEADEDCLGRVISDMVAMRGEFDTPLIQKGWFRMEACVPVATAMEYPVAFAALTGGRGLYSSEFYEYRPCPLELGATAKRRGIDPRDRSKWILHARSAL